MNYKQITLITCGLISLIFIKQILFVCGVVFAFNFAKENLLYADARDKFLNQFVGTNPSQEPLQTEFLDP